MKIFKVDTRGNLAVEHQKFFDVHKQIAKRFTMIVQGNNAKDFECDDPSFIAEYKIGKDAHDYPRLQRELQEVYGPSHADHKYLILVDPIDPQDMRVILSMLDKFFPLIRIKYYSTIEKAIAGVLSMLEEPPSYQSMLTAPVDYRDQDKGMILSLSARMNGITPDLAKFIWEYEENGKRVFTSERDFYFQLDTEKIGECYDIHPTTEAELIYLFDKIFLQFYGRNMNVLAQKFAHTFFQEYGK
jgi:hypothetical protein